MEKKKPLYIPIKTLDSEDYVTGLGKLELAIILFATGIALLIGIIIAFLINSLVGISTGIFIIATVFVVVRRDNNNESMIRKMKIIRRYNRTQKSYSYSYDSNFDYSDEEYEND